MDETRPLLTPDAVAARLNVSRSTVYRLINAGVLPALEVGGQRRIDPGELRAYVYGGADEEPSA